MIKKVEGFLRKKMAKKLAKKGQRLGNELSGDYKLMIDDIIKNDYELSSDVKELISFYKDKVNKFCNEYNLEGVEIFNRVLGACLYQGYLNYAEGKESDVLINLVRASGKIFEYAGVEKEGNPFYIKDTLAKFKNFMNSDSFITPIRKFIYKNNTFPTLSDMYINKSHNEAKIKEIEKVYKEMDKYRNGGYIEFLKSDFPDKIEEILESGKYFSNILVKYAFFITVVGFNNKDMNIDELYQKLSVSTYTMGKVEEKSKKKESLIDLTLYTYDLNDLVDVCRILATGEYDYEFLYLSFVENTIDGGMMGKVAMEKYDVYHFSKMISYDDMAKYLHDNLGDTIYPNMDEFSEFTPTVIISKMISEYCEIDTVAALPMIPNIIQELIPRLSINVTALFKTYDFCENSAKYFRLQMMARTLLMILLYLFLEQKEIVKRIIMDNDEKAMNEMQEKLVNFLNDGVANSGKKDLDIYDTLNIYAEKLSECVNINVASFDFGNLNLCKEFASLLSCTSLENIDLNEELDEEMDEEIEKMKKVNKNC